MENKYVQRIQELQNQIHEYKVIIAQKDRIMAEDQQTIAQLESLLDDAIREKRSIESELENLRGY